MHFDNIYRLFLKVIFFEIFHLNERLFQNQFYSTELYEKILIPGNHLMMQNYGEF